MSRRKHSSTPDDDELHTIERTALLCAHLLSGRTLTIEEAQEITGLSQRSVYYHLNAMSHVLPIYSDCGVWRKYSR